MKLIFLLFSVSYFSCNGKKNRTENSPTQPTLVIPDCKKIAEIYAPCVDFSNQTAKVNIAQWKKEFRALCISKKEWQPEMLIMEKCLKTSTECTPFLHCVFNSLASLAWKTAQTVKINEVPGDIRLGQGKIVVVLFFDASKAKCNFILKTLARIQAEKPVFTLIIKPTSNSQEDSITAYVATQLGKLSYPKQLSFIESLKIDMDISGFTPDPSVIKNIRINSEFLENSVINSLPVVIISGKSFEGIRSENLYKNLINISSESQGVK